MRRRIPSPTGRSAARLAVPRCALGESPRWAHGRWWWVDAGAGTVWSASPGFDDVSCELSIGQRISLVHPARDGRIVVALGAQIAILDPITHALSPWADIELEPGWLLNDGTADHHGNLWIGSVHPDRSAGTGRLHRLALDGTVSSALSATALSNGMVWASADTLLHVDSLSRTITSRRIEQSTVFGLRSEDSWSLPEHDGLALPDGMALDLEGGIWVALYGAGEIVRFVRGRVADVITVPTAQATSVALGGVDGRDLLITTAQEGLDASALAQDPSAGALFAARADVPGAPLLELLTP